MIFQKYIRNIGFYKASLLVFIGMVMCTTLSAQFSPGTIVVLQAGSGASEPLANTGNTMFLKEYNSSGTAGIVVAVPNTGTGALLVAGNSTAEGYPSLSADGGSVALSGYLTNIGGSTNLTTSTSASINRGISTVDYSGLYNFQSSSSTAFSTGNIRGAASDGVDDFWAVGSVTGVCYFGDGTPATVSTTVTNNRAIAVSNGQLYFSSGAGTNRGIYKVGNGTPVNSGNTSSIVINTGATASPYQFAFNPAGTVCYIADDRAIASGGGIQKWTFNGSTWSLAYTMSTVGASTVGTRGLAVDFSGANPVIYATTTETTANRLIKITDTGTAAGANATAVLLVTAPAATAFRGVTLSPKCTPVDITAVNSNSPFCTNGDLELSVSATGTTPFNYTWSGTGTFVPNNTAAAPHVSGASAGTYSVTVTNACGSDNGSVNVTTEEPTLWYADFDNDGFGDENNTLLACGQPLNYSDTFGDCNDNAPSAFPGATEILCNDVDDDCDGDTDEGRIDGCNDASAINFDPDATCNDGSCTYTACDGDAGGLEDIVVETYYISDSNDATDETGGSLVAGSTTYRIYVDMAPGYELQAVYGNPNHQLYISTSTEFFNNFDRGETTGRLIGDNRLDENTVALDSWIAMGGASTIHSGILKAEDPNGSIVGGSNNDGGSANIANGLISNEDPAAGIPVTTSDGLIPSVGPAVTAVGLDLSMFDNLNSSDPLVTNSGAWSVLEGVQGPTSDNRVLVAQITTDGELTFTLNVQLGTPDGETEQYVASNAIGNERTCINLSFPVANDVPGCMDETACNFDPAATEDDGSCIYPGCIDPSACNYNSEAGCDDGSCTYPGCTDVAACNFDLSAGCDDGSCTYPGCTDITACNYNATAGCNNGSCTYPGCTNPAACNYNASAGCDNGSCTFPGCTNPTACNYNATAGCDDGSCTFPGCTNPTACNYNASAGCDNGSCTFPGCNNPTACNYNPAAGCNDGTCILPNGCTDPSACNYNASATCDDGSCILPDGCTDPEAFNYDPSALCDDGSCILPTTACDGAPGGLENVIVEKYYISDSNDATDTDGGSLAAGSTTYRVYVDMAPGYELQAVYGNPNHQLDISTTSEWFNNEDRGETTGDQIGSNFLDENTVALDSWLGMSGASNLHVGVLKTEDGNGSIVGGSNNDGGSANIAAGLLSNNDPESGIPLTTSDGLIPGSVPVVTIVGLDVSMFGTSNSSMSLLTNSGAYSVLDGVTGPTGSNRVLIGQFTTTGDFSFNLNLQLGTPGGDVEQYVWSNPVGAERTCEQLVYPPFVIVPGCMDDTACNYNSEANEDDGSCTYPGCIDDTACNYNSEAGCDDGSCTYPGCTDATACNFDSEAGCDDGSCTYPGCTDATACNYNAAAGCNNGTCTYPGCNNPIACNYNPAAGCDDGSCEFPGCTDVTACNYDASAGCDDGSCVFSPCIPNDIPSGAIPLTLNPQGYCGAYSDNLSGATDSPESSSSGSDLWFSFVPVTSGVRITADDIAPQNLAIGLYDNALNPVDFENIVSGNGNELLNIGSLTAGNTYYVSVSNVGTGNGAFSICVSSLIDTRCEFGPGPYQLCQSFKADFVAANAYAFHFTSNTTNLTYSKTQPAPSPGTVIVLSTVPGLPWNDTYTVRIGAVWNLYNGLGNIEAIEVLNDEPCQMIVTPEPTMVLRPSDNCVNHGPHFLGSTIAGQPFICGAVDYEWEFVRTDIPELPIYKLRGAANRFINLMTIPGLVSGGVYNVRVRPIFSNGPGTFGAADCLSLVGPAMSESVANGSDFQDEISDKVEFSEIATAVYPNPNSGELINVNLTGLSSDVVNIEVRDQVGKLVYRTQLIATEGRLNNIIVFDQQLAGGMYIVNFFSDEEMRTERFIVTR